MKTLINGVKALKDGDANSFDLVKFINRNIVSGKIKVNNIKVLKDVPTFNSSDTPVSLSLDSAGNLSTSSTAALFVTNSQIAPSSAGAPTLTEINTFLNSQSAEFRAAAKNRVIYYNGTNNASTAYTYAYLYTGDSKLFLIDKP